MVLLWLLTVYHLGLGRRIATRLPRPPGSWSPVFVGAISPPLILWGLYCSGVLIRQGSDDTLTVSAEETLFRSFPFVLMVAAIMLIVTGRTISATRPAFLASGLACAAAYVLIWMFNGKRSHSLIAVLATVCAVYVTRMKRPSWPVLLSTAFVGTLVVAIAIGWRNDRDHGARSRDLPASSATSRSPRSWRASTSPIVMKRLTVTKLSNTADSS